MRKQMNILGLLAASQARPEHAGLDLRLELASIVLRGLERRGWTQKRLAEAAGMQEAVVSRIVHSDTNCEFETAGRICSALGVEVTLTEKPSEQADVTPASGYQIYRTDDSNHVEKAVEAEADTDPYTITAWSSDSARLG